MKVKNFVVLASTLALCACGGEAEKAAPVAQQYDLMTIERQDVTLTTKYSALILGRQESKIIPRVSGHLMAIKVNEGQKVRKGQVMFILDQAPMRAALKAAEASVALCKANVATAELNLEGKKELFANDVISKFDLAIAENNVASAKAQLLQAEANQMAAKDNLSYTEVKSPTNGVVGMLPYNIGDLVGPTTVNGLTIVAENDNMDIFFSMGEGQMLDLIAEYPSMDEAVKSMPEIELELNNRTVYPCKGEVESISGVVDAATGSVSLRANFPNDEGKLLSGGAGNVIMPYTKEDIFLVPQAATYEIQNKTYVYKVIDGKATASVVEIDKVNDGKNYIVLSGVEEGDVIIAKGAGLVREGALVKVN